LAMSNPFFRFSAFITGSKPILAVYLETPMHRPYQRTSLDAKGSAHKVACHINQLNDIFSNCPSQVRTGKGVNICSNRAAPNTTAT
jgi:hypothetical protein